MSAVHAVKVKRLAQYRLRVFCNGSMLVRASDQHTRYVMLVSTSDRHTDYRYAGQDL